MCQTSQIKFFSPIDGFERTANNEESSTSACVDFGLRIFRTGFWVVDVCSSSTKREPTFVDSEVGR